MPPIYHITHINNLPGILSAGGLWSDTEVARRCPSRIQTANQEIKDRRKHTVVPIAKRGVVADYVPFYFAPRSPMLYSIHTGYAGSYGGGQSDIVHLVSSTEAVYAGGVDCCFTDGHPIMALTGFYADASDLGSKVDWKIMSLKYWNDVHADMDRKRRRNAEFLVHRFFPWTLVQEIGVINVATKNKIRNIISGIDHKPVVSVCRTWYY